MNLLLYSCMVYFLGQTHWRVVVGFFCFVSLFFLKTINREKKKKKKILNWGYVALWETALHSRALTTVVISAVIRSIFMISYGTDVGREAAIRCMGTAGVSTNRDKVLHVSPRKSALWCDRGQGCWWVRKCVLSPSPFSSQIERHTKQTGPEIYFSYLSTGIFPSCTHAALSGATPHTPDWDGGPSPLYLFSVCVVQLSDAEKKLYEIITERKST